MLRLIGQLIKGTEVVGYRVYNQKQDTYMDCSIEEAKTLILRYGCYYAKVRGTEIEFERGMLDRLPQLDADTLKCKLNFSIIILAKVVKNSKILYFITTDVYGQMLRLTAEEIVLQMQTGVYTSIYNGRVSFKNGQPIIVSLIGKFPIVEE